MPLFHVSVRHLTDYVRRRWRPLLILFFGLLLPFLGFVKIAQEVFEKEPFAFEEPLMLAIHAYSSPALNHVTAAFSLLGSARGMAPIALILVAALYRVKRSRAYFMAVSLGGVALINLLLKNLFDRPRPTFWTPFLPEPDFSFPSGHAMFASALATSVIALLWATRWRIPALVIGTLYVLGMMLSRVYIGVHYPTDVTGGALFSLAWVFGLSQILHIHRVPPTSRVSDAAVDEAHKVP
ncbi:phosphatase PAP2 family protein (plasmid) [Deinococcus taeanensis]|uniref:phosphatase PAP2 family protein n=1 Tax=Deinococcus taeanensis TaxID=2737050 RepID=UPI001CDD534C|nr:phosphatase PAP2 family protein [Deinococcus taeanensis]UBV45299.1 phosphatase PAP2 family protein [Deinococcus taeanensis]